MSLDETHLLPEIRNRRAHRALSSRPVPRETAKQLLLAAHVAPSCFNHQPWRLIAIDEPSLLAAIKETMPGGNYWTEPAPLVIAVASRLDLDCQLSDGRDYFLLGCGMAIGNLMIEATRHGLIAHPIAGYKPTRVKSLLDIPEDYTLITLVIVGFPGDPSTLSDKHQAIERGPRQRYPLEQIAFWNRFDLKASP